MIAQYQNSEAIAFQLHDFFESLIPYLFMPKGVTHGCVWDYDNYRFIVEELFLFCLAILIRNNRFILASTLINKEYFFDTPIYGYGKQDKLHNFNIFQTGVKSLDFKKRVEQINVYDLHADILEKRSANIHIKSQDIHQTDFILFLIDARNVLEGLSSYQSWYAKTMIYQDASWGRFEIFNRATSCNFFEKIKCLFGINSKEELGIIFDAFRNRQLRKIEYGRGSINPDYYVEYEQLCTKP